MPAILSIPEMLYEFGEILHSTDGSHNNEFKVVQEDKSMLEEVPEALALRNNEQLSSISIENGYAFPEDDDERILTEMPKANFGNEHEKDHTGESWFQRHAAPIGGTTAAVLAASTISYYIKDKLPVSDNNCIKPAYWPLYTALYILSIPYNILITLGTCCCRSSDNSYSAASSIIPQHIPDYKASDKMNGI